jgi:hypothetical protein
MPPAIFDLFASDLSGIASGAPVTCNSASRRRTCIAGIPSLQPYFGLS